MLGKAFVVPENTVRTYAEAEIRAGYDSFLSLGYYYSLYLEIDYKALLMIILQV